MPTAAAADTLPTGFLHPNDRTKAAHAPITPATSEYMTEREVAALLRCSLRHLANLRARGDLPFFHVGRRRIIYRRIDVLRFLERGFVAGRKEGADAA